MASSSSTMTQSLPTFPPLAALFLTYFDDLKGQTIAYYSAIDNLTSGSIEHKTLPSGLHALKSDLVFITHGYGTTEASEKEDLPGVGLFRSVEVEGSGRGRRGRRMGTLGVVLAQGRVDELFDLREGLEKLYDHITPSDISVSPFTAVETKTILDEVWEGSKASVIRPSRDVGRIREIVQGRTTISPAHPISFFPALLLVLNPLIVTVYRCALAGKRILLYSPPPLLPVAAFAWCIQAMSVPPSAAGEDAEVSRWIGNVGLMDLDEVKRRKGGWIATTSDAIYKTHTKSYDLFIDLSAPSSTSLHPSSLASAANRNAHHHLHDHDHPQGEATLFTPPASGASSSEPVPITYTFADVPLYRSLLLLELSPPSVTISSKLGVRGNLWLWAFEVFERAWKLCRGVCEYALGQGNVGPQGDIRLGDGEEDARLIDPGEVLGDDDDGTEGEENGSEDEAVRVGRLLLRQFHHNTYHLYKQLKKVRRGAGGPLTEAELKELCGRSWRWSSVGESAEGRWWNDLARVWGVAVEVDE